MISLTQSRTTVRQRIGVLGGNTPALPAQFVTTVRPADTHAVSNRNLQGRLEMPRRKRRNRAAH